MNTLLIALFIATVGYDSAVGTECYKCATGSGVDIGGTCGTDVDATTEVETCTSPNGTCLTFVTYGTDRILTMISRACTPENAACEDSTTDGFKTTCCQGNRCNGNDFSLDPNARLRCYNCRYAGTNTGGTCDDKVDETTSIEICSESDTHCKKMRSSFMGSLTSVTRSCSSTCKESKVISEMVACCQTSLCNGNDDGNYLESLQCYSCTYASGININGGSCGNQVDSTTIRETCSATESLCQTMTVTAVGMLVSVTRSCSSFCADTDFAGIDTKCCQTNLCNGNGNGEDGLIASSLLIILAMMASRTIWI